MAELIKMGGKAVTSGVAKPVLLTEDGNQIVLRKWNSMVEELYPLTEIRNTSYRTITTTAVKDYGLISLRINNQLYHMEGDTKVYNPIKLLFLGEYVDHSGGKIYVRNATSNEYYSIDIGGGYTILTPDEFPFMNYFEKMSIAFKAIASPEAGDIQIWGVYKG